MVAVALPDTDDKMPDELTYDTDTRTLAIGEGRVAPVAPEVVAYEVSGMNVLRKWFSYRRATRPQSRGEQSPLDDVRPTSWSSAYTTDLLEFLHVLTMVTDLELAQSALLDQVMEGPRITVADLTEVGVLPIPVEARSPLPKLTRTKLSPDQLGLPLLG